MINTQWSLYGCLKSRPDDLVSFFPSPSNGRTCFLVNVYFGALCCQDNNDKTDKKDKKKKTAAAAAAASTDGEKMDTGEAAAEGATDDKPTSKQIAHQGVAVLGIALIAMGEDIGSEMCVRSFGNLVSVCSSHFARLICFSAKH